MQTRGTVKPVLKLLDRLQFALERKGKNHILSRWWW